MAEELNVSGEAFTDRNLGMRPSSWLSNVIDDDQAFVFELAPVEDETTQGFDYSDPTKGFWVDL